MEVESPDAAQQHHNEPPCKQACVVGQVDVAIALDVTAVANDSVVEGEGMVAVIVPVYNAAAFLDAALESVLAQTASFPAAQMHVSICDDGSTDGSLALIAAWLPRLRAAGMCATLTCSRAGNSGPGAARNSAVRATRTQWLCFLDADDIMAPARVAVQLAAAQTYPDAIIGSNYTRLPENATERYARWCREVAGSALATQRFRDCTVVQPTWFCGRVVFDRLGGYEEAGLAEDLKFFYRQFEYWLVEHADEQPRGGMLVHKCPETLLQYRHHAASLTQRVSLDLLRDLRAAALARQVLLRVAPWTCGFGVWGAGKNGRRFYRSLPPAAQALVTCFYDIDPKKIAHPFCDGGRDGRPFIRRIPIRHVCEITAPFVSCVSLDRTDGDFERHLAAMPHFVEGEHYFLFA